MLEKSISFLRQGVSPTSRVFNYVGGGLLVVIVLITVADVILRRLFHSPLRASMELTELFVGTVVFLALAYCAVRGAHIVVDVLIAKFPRRPQLNIVAIMQFMTTAMSAVLTWQLVLYAIALSQKGDYSIVLKWPIWVFVIIGAIGFGLLTLAFLIELMSTVVEARKR
jgi:TRAP-type C4-dicarboxylate transport system permease small subunit